MSWTYSEDPSTSPKDQVRFLIGDTDKNDPLLNDQEIELFLKTYNGGALMAAIRCCEQISAKFSRRVNETVGRVRMDFSQAAKAYRDLAMDLRRTLAINDTSFYAGGISRSDKQAVASQGDRLAPDFPKQMMDNHQIAPSTQIGTGQGTDFLQDTEVP